MEKDLVESARKKVAKKYGYKTWSELLEDCKRFDYLKNYEENIERINNEVNNLAVSKLAQKLKVPKTNIKSNITITIPLEVAETLQGFIDSGIGSSGDDEFTRQMKIVLKKLDKVVLKHYT